MKTYVKKTRNEQWYQLNIDKYKWYKSFMKLNKIF